MRARESVASTHKGDSGAMHRVNTGWGGGKEGVRDGGKCEKKKGSGYPNLGAWQKVSGRPGSPSVNSRQVEPIISPPLTHPCAGACPRPATPALLRPPLPPHQATVTPAHNRHLSEASGTKPTPPSLHTARKAVMEPRNSDANTTPSQPERTEVTTACAKASARSTCVEG